jgi:hypothetical protein
MPVILHRLLAPFTARGRVNRTLVAIFVFINGIALVNAWLHDPAIGYDSPEHLAYIETLAEGRLPTEADTAEFFCPPLPYALPAGLMATGVVDLWQAAKAAQLVNVLLSLGLIYYLIKICDLIQPGDVHLKIVSSALLGMLPVYYKTFAFVRGEPYLAFFAALAIHQALLVFVKGSRKRRHPVSLGIAIGLMVLSRQWGFFLLAGMIVFVALLWLRHRATRALLFKGLAISLAVAFVVGGWHYLILFKRYGTFAPFNRQASPEFALSNQPPVFYYGTGSGKLFSEPIREAFPNQLLPIFYSETWGDYWEYFLVWGRDVRTGEFLQGSVLQRALRSEPTPEWLQTNKAEIAAYLGRVNLISLAPSLLLLAGFALGMVSIARLVPPSTDSPVDAAQVLLALLVVTSLVGYLCFVIMFPNLKKGADTVKATYMLQIFPPLALLGGQILRRIRERAVPVYRTLLVLFTVICLHNLPAMFTRYVR